MNISRLYQGCIALVVSLFFIVQSSALAHAAKYSDMAHEHDGKSCILVSISDEKQAVILPPNNMGQDILPVYIGFAPVFFSTTQLIFRGRSPPLRGPPLFIF